MCGLSGRINGDSETLFLMTSSQCHVDRMIRSKERFRDKAYIGLGSRRLAIIDQCGWWRTGQCC